MIRSKFGSLLLRRHRRRHPPDRSVRTPVDPGRRATVFSPHFDDETLGCGGTIIKKRSAGADVQVVFMTDGSKSHQHLMPADDLSKVRKSESLAAGNVLGLEKGDLFFLDFEETRLKDHVDPACERVLEILREVEPDDIFVPHAKEPLLWSADHTVTNKVLMSALARYQKPVIVYEYPIWFWYHWPWVRPPFPRHLKETWVILKHTFAYRFGMRLFSDFNSCVYVGDVLEVKRRALEAYRSQMTRLVPNPRWTTLEDVSRGDFLACFFHENEIYRRWEHSPPIRPRADPEDSPSSGI